MKQTIRLNEEEFRNFLKNVVTESVDEISRNKKAQIKRQAVNSVFGKEDNVKTFVILTGENPMGEKGGNNLNRNANSELVQYLNMGNFAWQSVSGKYGNTENSKIIFNVTLEDAKKMGLQFRQESFIYGRKEGETTYFDLYMINPEHTDYDFTETQTKVDKVGNGQKDFYTGIDKKNKFNIPFEIFNEACVRFNKVINEAKVLLPKYRQNFERSLNESLKPNKTGNSRYMHRSLLYGKLFENASSSLHPMQIWNGQVVLKHDSSDRINNGVVDRPRGKHNPYSNNSDIGNYFWASEERGKDPSNGKSNVYYCFVPVNEIYDMMANPKQYEDVETAAENERYVAVNWPVGQGAVVVVSQQPTPITFIEHNGDDNDGLYDANWNLIRSGYLPYYGSDYKRLAEELEPYRNVEVPDFLEEHFYSYDDLVEAYNNLPDYLKDDDE